MGLIFKGQESWPLKMRSTGFPRNVDNELPYSPRNSPIERSSRESVTVIALNIEFRT
jgi:hypothetical protein